MKREREESGEQQQPAKKVATAPSVETTQPLSEFVCRLKFANKLPVVTSEAKLLELPLDTARLGAYRGTDLDVLYKHELHCPRDLRIATDLALLVVTPQSQQQQQQQAQPQPQGQQQQQQQAQLDAADEELITWAPPVQQQQPQQPQPGSGMASALRPMVSWLRKPEYLESESAAKRRERSLQVSRNYLENDAEPSAASAVAQAGDEGSATAMAAALSEQIRAIEETFIAARTIAPVNPRDPSMAAVSVLPVLPAFDLLPTTYDVVTVEGDPLAGDSSSARYALIKGFVTSEGDTFVAYLAPKSPAAAAARSAEQQQHYRWVHAFKYAFLEDPATKFGLVVDGTTARFFDLNQRVSLTKPRDKQQIEHLRAYVKPTRITAVASAMTEEERSEREVTTERLLRPAADAVLLRRAESQQQ